jgi:hypothetical protein
MFYKQGMAALVALALAACGGSGGTGSSGGAIVTPTPGSTPIPSTPAPSPSYLSARDFTQDRVADDFGVRKESFEPYGAPARPTRILSLSTTTTLGAIGFTYRASSKSYRANYLTDVRDFTRIRPYDDTSSVGDQDYNPADPSPIQRYFRVVQSGGGNAQNGMEYVGFVSWSDYANDAIDAGERGGREVYRYHLYGAHTVTSDLPKTGTDPYRLNLFPLSKEVDVQINWVTGEITGAARIPCSAGETCPNGDLGDVRLAGSFDGNFRILGTIGGSAGYTGTFVGGFYGPRALEIGIVGDLRHATRRNDIFVTTAKRRD